MPLVYAALTPHSPILIPTIGKENIEKLNDTVIALNTLEKELYSHVPEVLVIISPDSDSNSDEFKLDIGSQEKINRYYADFKEFGEFSTDFSFRHDPGMASTIADKIQDSMPVKFVSNEVTDYKFSVPLSYLTAHLPDISVVTISCPEIQREKAIEFGQKLQDIFKEYPKRVAVIGSVNLSHALQKDSPAGYSEQGVKADQKIQEFLDLHDFEGLAKINTELIDEAVISNFQVLLVMSGIIQRMNFHYKKLCYESPFGIGYLTAEFELP